MFGTSGIRGEVGEAVTAELALNVGRALGTDHSKVVVGRDPRESGRVLADSVSVGARECGASVVRLGLASTPTIARSVSWLEADVGVAVTASHNPPSDNGIKLWTPSGRAFDVEQRRRVRRHVIGSQYDFADWDGTGDETTWDGAPERHAETLAAQFAPVEDLTVAVDVGNGAGGVTVDALDALGCDVVTLNAQPDGTFPGRPSEPTEETCRDLRRQVAASDADLGIAHDGDADRMMAVTGSGEFVLGDVLLALFATDRVTEGDEVAVPVDASRAVDEVVSSRGGSVRRTRVGDVYVAAQATDDEVVFGGEASGAWIWPDDTLCPDGPLAACRLATMVDRWGPLSSLVDDVPTYPIRRTSIETNAKEDAMREIERRLSDRYGEVDTTDGVRGEEADGWFLVRSSGTQPLVRVTVEGETEDSAASLFEDVTDVVETVTAQAATESIST
jgi:phosphoglucosamine mutase